MTTFFIRLTTKKYVTLTSKMWVINKYDWYEFFIVNVIKGTYIYALHFSAYNLNSLFKLTGTTHIKSIKKPTPMKSMPFG